MSSHSLPTASAGKQDAILPGGGPVMNSVHHLKQQTCAIVVSYYPAPRIVQNVAALREQVDCVLVIDNGSTGDSLKYLHAIQQTQGCTVHFLGENLGIAAAMNRGVEIATESGFKWLFTFDQDSTVTTGFVVAMLAEYELHRERQHVGIVSPLHVDPASSRRLRPFLDPNGHPLTVMTSGNMVPTSVFQQCGTFAEILFIDYVDHEFCLRLRDHGYSIIECQNAVLLHSLGQLRNYHILGLRFGCTHHSAGRRYYMTRNRIWLYRKMLRRHWNWCKLDILSLFQELAKLLIFEEKRATKLRGVWRGIHDGLAGRMGKTLDL